MEPEDTLQTADQNGEEEDLNGQEAVDLPNREAMTMISGSTGPMMPIDPFPPIHQIPDPIPVNNE